MKSSGGTVLQRDGKKQFVVLRWEEFVALRELAEDAQDYAELRSARKANRHRKSLSHDEVKRRLGVK